MVDKRKYAVHAWVEKHRETPIPVNGNANFAAVIGRYMEMVPTLAKRPRTKENRLFRAKKRLAFVESIAPDMTIGEFDAAMFEQYLGWLRTVRGHRPQTCQLPRSSPRRRRPPP